MFLSPIKTHFKAAVRSARSTCWGLELKVTATAITITVALAQIGGLELGECILFDAYVRHRPPTEPDPNIVLVTIDDQDLFDSPEDDLPITWPLPDDVVIETIRTITPFQPRVIGLHLYFPKRNDAPRKRLKALIETTENLIGMEKVVGSQRSTPSLFPREQLAISDMVLDDDASVRRGLVAIFDREAKSYLSWGAQLALEYLAAESVVPIRQQNGDVQLGKSIIHRLEAGDGGYSPQLDTGGFQILMDYRGALSAFTTISLRDVRSGNFSPELFRDKIVAIGPISPYLKTAYRTPVVSTTSNTHIAALGINNPQDPPNFSTFSKQGLNQPGKTLVEDNDNRLMSSLLIHINLTSQLLESALLGERNLGTVPAWVQWSWVTIGAGLGAQTTRKVQRSRLRSLSPMVHLVLLHGGRIIVILGVMLGLGYAAVRAGWWIPTIAPIVAFGIASSLRLIHRSYRLYRLASYDALTGVGNRRLFDASLAELQAFSLAKHKPFAVILCDIDWFKAYNDTYGHQQGDRCLQAIAQAISRVVREDDIVTRYGGEEFAILLPETSADQAVALAECLCRAVHALKIEHRGSKAGAYVTLSCGLAVWFPSQAGSGSDLIQAADRALYRSKDQGRNTWQLEANWQNPTSTIGLNSKTSQTSGNTD